MGSGIGYGYLHRIPVQPFTEGKPLIHSVPPATDPVVMTPPVANDGFPEVQLQPSVTDGLPTATNTDVLPGNIGLPTTTYSVTDSHASASFDVITGAGIPPLVNISLPPATFPTDLPPINLAPGISPIPSIPNLPPLPVGIPLPDLQTLAASLPPVANLSTVEPPQETIEIKTGDSPPAGHMVAPYAVSTN
uniref:Uncharacterized protein n=1 Tax=Ciona savignyi TaxID=51511 RepID=H2YGM0_CIOSA